MDVTLSAAIPSLYPTPSTLDRETVLHLVQANPSILANFPQFNSDPEFMEAAIRLNSECFRWAAPEILDNERLLKIALIGSPHICEFASPRLLFRFEFDQCNTWIANLNSSTEADTLEQLSSLKKELIRHIGNCPELLESAMHVAQNRPDLIPHLPVAFRDRLEVIVLQEDLTGTRVGERFNWIATCKKVERSLEAF